MKLDHQSLCHASNAELEKLMAASPGPDPSSLVGWEFCGWNTPAFASLLGIRKFIKGFFLPSGSDDAADLMGFNEPVGQNPFDQPWAARPSPESPKRFGFYRVGVVGEGERYPGSLLLDYGACPENFVLATRRLRDYLVQVDPGNPDLLLGKAYLDLWLGWVPTSFFVLKRLREHSWRR